MYAAPLLFLLFPTLLVIICEHVFPPRPEMSFNTLIKLAFIFWLSQILLVLYSIFP